MTKFEEEFNYLIELSGKVLIGQVGAGAFEKNRIAFFEKYETDQQQALPVVPELTQKQADILNDYKNGSGSLASYLSTEIKKGDYDYFARAWLDGYTVEKPQLFYIALPKIYGLSDPIFVSKAESGIISEFTKGKDYALKLTEQEIKSLDERYWQFAVPVEVKE